jgi:tetratricopeptide (TPR) repeat protein
MPRLLAAAILCVLPLAAATAQQAASGPDAAPAETRTASYAEFRRLFESNDYAAAVPVALRVVEQTEAHFGPDHPEMQVALMNLATAQRLAGDSVGAEVSYQRVIALIEDEGKLASPRLARAEAGLATTYHAAKRHDVAVTHFERALALNRRSEGLFNTEQLPLLASYADSLTQLQRYQDALNAQEYAMRIAERQYGKNDPRLAPVLESVGRWLVGLGAYDPGRQRIRRAITLVEDARGPNDAALIGPLTALAESYRRQVLEPGAGGSSYEPIAPTGPEGFGSPPPTLSADGGPSAAMLSHEGLRALERANAIADGLPAASPALLADVRTQLGDWYQTRLQHERALPYYEQAWRAAQQVQHAGTTLAEYLFGSAVLLHYVPPGYANPERLRRVPYDQIETRFVEVAVDVSEQGRVRDPRIVSNQGTERMGVDAVEAAATARYRPRLVDGKPVASSGVTFRQGYRTLRQDEPEATPAP